MFVNIYMSVCIHVYAYALVFVCVYVCVYLYVYVSILYVCKHKEGQWLQTMILRYLFVRFDMWFQENNSIMLSITKEFFASQHLAMMRTLFQPVEICGTTQHVGWDEY